MIKDLIKISNAGGTDISHQQGSFSTAVTAREISEISSWQGNYDIVAHFHYPQDLRISSTYFNSNPYNYAAHEPVFNGVIFIPSLSTELAKTAVNMKLSPLYEIENSDDVINFITKHPGIADFLIDLNNRLHTIFESHFRAKLRLVELDKNWNTLFVEVENSLEEERGRKVIDGLLNWIIENYPMEYKFINVINSSQAECLSTQ